MLSAAVAPGACPSQLWPVQPVLLFAAMALLLLLLMLWWLPSHCYHSTITLVCGSGLPA